MVKCADGKIELGVFIRVVSRVAQGVGIPSLDKRVSSNIQ